MDNGFQKVTCFHVAPGSLAGLIKHCRWDYGFQKVMASMRLLAVLQDFLCKMITTALTIYLYCQADNNKNKTKRQQQKLI